MKQQNLEEAARLAISMKKRNILLEQCQDTGSNLTISGRTAVTITADDKMMQPLKELLAHRLRQDIQEINEKLRLLGVTEQAA
jgi:hypothetical protein